MVDNPSLDQFINFFNQNYYPKVLNSIQEKILRDSYDGKTYGEIAKTNGYDPGYIKTVGYQLWELLSEYLQTKVKKKNIEIIVRNYCQQLQRKADLDYYRTSINDVEKKVIRRNNNYKQTAKSQPDSSLLKDQNLSKQDDILNKNFFVSPNKLRTLYPLCKPYDKGQLKVSDLHTIYYEQSGNPQGKPVIILHERIGAGFSSVSRRYFNPQKWRIINFDQRGCGKSKPHGELRENTTWDLVADIEKIRIHLQVEKWVVFGGMWGSALSLAYSQTHQDRCLALILRSIFTIRQQEIDWFFYSGISCIFPDAWYEYLKLIPREERGDLISAYYQRLNSPDKSIRLKAICAWSAWGAKSHRLNRLGEDIKSYCEIKFAEAFAKIECHYFKHKGFLKTDDQLIANCDRISAIPGAIIQGRYDVLCPMVTSWELHQAWRTAQYVVVSEAGHSVDNVYLIDAIIKTTDRFAD